MALKQRYSSWCVDFRFDSRRIRKISPVNSNEGAKDYELRLSRKLIKGEPLEDKEDE